MAARELRPQLFSTFFFSRHAALYGFSLWSSAHMMSLLASRRVFQGLLRLGRLTGLKVLQFCGSRATVCRLNGLKGLRGAQWCASWVGWSKSHRLERQQGHHRCSFTHPPTCATTSVQTSDVWPTHLPLCSDCSEMELGMARGMAGAVLGRGKPGGGGSKC